MTHLQRLKRIRPTEPFWGRGVTAAQQTFNLAGDGFKSLRPHSHRRLGP